MKALFINGGPRKNWSTAKMLESAMKGAAEAGAETELIHLFDYSFHGCRSCLACKLKNAKTGGVCLIRDDLRPILEKTHEADVIVIGSPIYFSYPTGVTRAFLERLMFPVLSYNPTPAGEDEPKRLVPTAMIYTMGAMKEMTEEVGYPLILGENERFLKQLFGYSETLCTYNSYQFGDYARYDVMEGVEERRAKYRDEQLPKDLEAAYALGKRLVEKAGG